MQVPTFDGSKNRWAWPVFRRPDFIPKGSLCLADMVDRIGKALYDNQWPDIFTHQDDRARGEAGYAAGLIGAGSSLLTGVGTVADKWYRRQEPRLDPAHNEMVGAALTEARRILYALDNAAYMLDEDGRRWQVPQRAWATRDASVVISLGHAVPGWCAGLPPEGSVYVDATAFERATDVGLEAQVPHDHDGEHDGMQIGPDAAHTTSTVKQASTDEHGAPIAAPSMPTNSQHHPEENVPPASGCDLWLAEAKNIKQANPKWGQRKIVAEVRTKLGIVTVTASAIRQHLNRKFPGWAK